MARSADFGSHFLAEHMPTHEHFSPCMPTQLRVALGLLAPTLATAIFARRLNFLSLMCCAGSWHRHRRQNRTHCREAKGEGRAHDCCGFRRPCFRGRASPRQRGCSNDATTQVCRPYSTCHGEDARFFPQAGQQNAGAWRKIGMIRTHAVQPNLAIVGRSVLGSISRYGLQCCSGREIYDQTRHSNTSRAIVSRGLRAGVARARRWNSFVGRQRALAPKTKCGGRVRTNSTNIGPESNLARFGGHKACSRFGGREVGPTSANIKTPGLARNRPNLARNRPNLTRTYGQS